MALINQKHLPIVFTMFGGGGIPIIVPFNIPLIGLVRPDSITINRVARGTVTHTATSAFLDDFGEGVPTLLIHGNTGWSENITAGVVGFKLIEAMFIEYLRRRKRLSMAGMDPNAVRLWYIDALNLEAFSVYPNEFSLERSRNNSLLFFYRMRFTVLVDLLTESAHAVGDALFSGASIGEALDAIGAGIGAA